MALYYGTEGSVGYTVVGSPTITNGIASNFGADSYLQLTQAFNPLGQNWEAVFDLTTGSDVTSEQYFFSSQKGASYDDRYGIRLGIQNGTFLFSAAVSGFTPGLSGGTVSANTSYLVRFGKNSSGRYIDVLESGSWVNKATNGNTDATMALTNTRISGYTGYSSNWFPFKGSINLNNSYISLGGQPWFGVYRKSVNAVQLRGPVGYTVVGSPTISNGEVSGFSDSDYISITQSFPLTTSDWEMCFKAITTPNNAQQRIIYGGGLRLSVLGIIPEWNLYCGSDSASVYGGEASVYPYTKIIKSGHTITLYQSTDGITYSFCGSTTDSYLSNSDSLSIGGSSLYWNGSIDLNNTYIKINGKLWFWQPREVEKVVANNVVVWEKPA